MELFSVPVGVESNYERTAKFAMRLAMRVLPQYATPTSRKCFTLRQLAALAVLRAAYGLTYRQLQQLLFACPAICHALNLKRVPHYTTIESFANRAGMDALVQSMLDAFWHEMHEQGVVDEARVRAPDNKIEVAIDSTGAEATCASVYFSRKKQGSKQGPYSAYAKLSVAVVCGLLFPTSLVTDWGPSADTKQAQAVVLAASQRLAIDTLYGDKGFDSESLHKLCREELGIESFIPPVIRAADGEIKTPLRAMMKELPDGYGRRWHVEAFMSSLKRLTGSTLRARGATRPLTELSLRVLAHAVRR